MFGTTRLVHLCLENYKRPNQGMHLTVLNRQVMIGSIFVMVPDAKVGERYSVRVTAIAENQYSGNVQAACEFALIGGTREGMCLPAP